MLLISLSATIYPLSIYVIDVSLDASLSDVNPDLYRIGMSDWADYLSILIYGSADDFVSDLIMIIGSGSEYLLPYICMGLRSRDIL